MERNVNMWWIVLGIIAVVILLIMSSCKAAGIADEQSDYIYQAEHRSDNNGNN